MVSFFRIPHRLITWLNRSSQTFNNLYEIAQGSGKLIYTQYPIPVALMGQEDLVRKLSMQPRPVYPTSVSHILLLTLPKRIRWYSNKVRTKILFTK